MSFVNKHKWELATILLLSLLYFAIRIPNLTLQPIFVDEAIYIRWAQVMRAEPTLRFLPLSDGKTPLFMWTMIPLLKIFEDPLFAGRFLSVILGFVTFLGVIFLGWKFFNPKVGLWAGLLIVFIPYMVFFDRMGLVDSMLAAFSIWSLNLALLLIKYPRIDLAMVLGYIVGGGILTKTPGFFNLITLPVSLLVFSWQEKNREKKLLKIFGLWTLTIIMTLAIYNILRLGPGFVNLTSRNQDYIRSPIEVLTRPWDPFLPHLRDLIDYLNKLLTVPIEVLTLLGVGLAIFLKNRLIFTILIWALVPMIVQMFLLQTFTARYLLFSIPPLLFIASWAIDFITVKIKLNNLLKLLIILIFILPLPLIFDFKLLTNPSDVPLPKGERIGYFEEWTAGYGFKNIASYLDQLSQNQDVIVGTEGSFGTLPDGLQIYLDKNRAVKFIGGPASVSASLRQASLKHPTFFVANKSRYSMPQENLELISEFPKFQREDKTFDAILFYKVLPI